MSATDNYFSCTETPIKLVDTEGGILKQLKTQRIRAKVRITSLVSGSGVMRPTTQGLAFDLPQTTLEFNGVRHTCYGCLLSFPAMHHIDMEGLRYTDLSAAEMHLQFKADQAINSFYTVVFPIRIGEGPGADFFALMGDLTRRPPFGDFLQEDTPLLLYTGTDVAGRVKGGACSDAVSKVQYLVALRPLHLRFTDLTRLKTILTTTGSPYSATVGPVRATRAVTALKLSLVSYIPSLLLTKPAAPKTIQNGYVEQAQVKCRPLDQSRDIRGSQVYVGGPGDYKTLQNELQDAADLSKGLDPDATADVSKIETILAIVLGLLIGLFLIALVVWWVFRKEGGYQKIALMWNAARLKSTIPDAVANAVNAAKATATT